MGVSWHFGRWRLHVLQKYLNFNEFYQFFLSDFFGQNVLILQTKMYLYLQNKMCQFYEYYIVNAIYFGNIRIVWNKKLYMKIWFNSKSLWILSIFQVWFFVPKYANIIYFSLFVWNISSVTRTKYIFFYLFKMYLYLAT